METIMAKPTPNPFGDMTKMLEKFTIPGVDMAAIIEARRKDIEALAESNKAALQAMQAIGSKQAEMLSAAMHEIQTTTQSLASSVGDPAKQTEIVKKAYAKALADAKDLAEMARKAQTDSMASMTKRANEHMAEIKKMMTPK
jgi:phasin family protein